MDIPCCNYQFQYKAPVADAITVRTIARGFLAPAGKDITRFGAYHFNDTGKSLLQLLVFIFTGGLANLSETFGFDSNHLRQKVGQLGQINDQIYAKLLELNDNPGESTISIDVIIKGSPSRIVITEESNSIKIKIGNDFAILEGMQFRDLEQKLVQETRSKIDDLDIFPERLITQLTERHTPSQGKPLSCPTNYDFISIHAGTAYQSATVNKKIADTATAAVVEGAFAATVVGGVGAQAKFGNSRIYSALITAAALHTVKQAILEENLDSGNLQERFWTKVKELDTDDLFSESQPENRGATFGGVVLFYDSQGNQKKFIYGLGNTVVATSDASSLVALGPDYRHVNALDVTAAVSNVVRDANSPNDEKLVPTTGDDVFHLSIDIDHAFKILDLAHAKQEKLIKYENTVSKSRREIELRKSYPTAFSGAV